MTSSPTEFHVEIQRDRPRSVIEKRIRGHLTLGGYDFYIDADTEHLGTHELEITLDGTDHTDISDIRQSIGGIPGVVGVSQMH